MVRTKKMDREGRWLKKMYGKQTIIDKVVAESLASKWCSHLSGVRWLDGL
jgi:hypothetical protein